MARKPVKLDDWARDLLVDPLDKGPLLVSQQDGFLVSSYGRRYPITNGIFDLRLLNNVTSKDQRAWREGQIEYERWSRDLAAHDRDQDYVAENESVRRVYDDIPVEGRCLDVGGHQGRLRHFLDKEQEYISCDPFLSVFDGLESQANLLAAFPCLGDPVNFVCCEAEFLPFKSCSFDTVHMRSVIDHFLNPELALNEAYRVLNVDGCLIVGLYVYGARLGSASLSLRLKDWLKNALGAIGVDRFRDHHVWHPTYGELKMLINECGFSIEKVHWQSAYRDTVCYVCARKKANLTRSNTDTATLNA